MKRRGILFCLVGPAGSGKSSLSAELLADFPQSLQVSISVTTRAPRAGEHNGVDYHFVTQEQFAQMESQGRFFEREQVHGNWYGTLRETLDNAVAGGYDLLLRIDIRGAYSMRAAYPADTVLIFLSPPTAAEMRSRILGRGEIAADDLQRRLQTARDEFSAFQNDVEAGGRIDYVVINDQRERAIAQLRAIIEGERCRTSRLDRTELKQLGRDV